MGEFETRSYGSEGHMQENWPSPQYMYGGVISFQLAIYLSIYVRIYISIVAKAVFLHVTFASITPCFKFTHPHHTVWTETISNPISIITYVPKIPTLLSTIPPPLFERGISGQDLKPRKGKGEQGIWNTWAKPRDLVIKRVTLQTGKGLQRERIRDELLEWVQFVPSFCPSVVR